MMKKLFSALAMAALVAACAEPVTSTPRAEIQDDPPYAASVAEPIPGQYIVVLKDQEISPEGVSSFIANRPSGRVIHRYTHAIRGFASQLSDDEVASLRADPGVAYVEQDQVYRAWTTQSNATWGLDRIDQRALPLSGTFTYTNTGSGVTAYIIDTGIDYAHNEFGGRAVFGFDSFGGNGDDCNGHGTHVAGTVGGTVYGVAKGVTLVSVRVLDCGGSGTTSGVIAGVDWVTAHHVGTNPAVANMSLGGGASTSLDDAVKRSIADGVSYAVAAGNGNWIGIHQDACKYSPARVPEAMTIGATDKTDKKASWSNYGKCVDWFAPGVSITSAWIGSGNTETRTISGTSMATPHTAGVAALYLQSNPAASPATVSTALYNATTKGIVTSSRTANNHLLYTNY